MFIVAAIINRKECSCLLIFFGSMGSIQIFIVLVNFFFYFKNPIYADRL